jgi:hypothetical protein
MSQRWTYHVEWDTHGWNENGDTAAARFDQRMNEMARGGWELVSTSAHATGNPGMMGTKFITYWRRPA